MKKEDSLLLIFKNKFSQHWKYAIVAVVVYFTDSNDASTNCI